MYVVEMNWVWGWSPPSFAFVIKGFTLIGELGALRKCAFERINSKRLVKRDDHHMVSSPLSSFIKCFWRVTERNLCYVWLLESVVWISQESEFLRLRSRSTIMSESVIRARDCDKVRRGSSQRQMGNLYWRGALHTNQQRPSLSFSMINVR